MISDVLLRRSELLLTVAGLALVSVTGLSLLRYRLFQSLPVKTQSTASSTGTYSNWRTRYLLSPGFRNNTQTVQVTGKLEIPRIRLSVLIVDGDEDEGLSVAAVHLAGSAPLGGPGNSVLAGHRDTAFWPLRNLEVGDLIRVHSPNVHRYLVDSIEIVLPDDTAVLESRPGSTLTLVTCYPFHRVGAAPKRFVVQAHLLS